MLLQVNYTTLKCKDCNIFLTDELFCIKCNHRISGALRTDLLKFYTDSRFSKFEDEIYHITPNHSSIVYYGSGCTECTEQITDCLSMLIKVEPGILPYYAEQNAKFIKFFKNTSYQITRDVRHTWTFETPSELVIDSD